VCRRSGDHLGKEAGLKYGFDCSRNKFTVGYRYCTRSSRGGAKKRHGDEEEYRQVTATPRGEADVPTCAVGLLGLSVSEQEEQASVVIVARLLPEDQANSQHTDSAQCTNAETGIPNFG